MRSAFAKIIEQANVGCVVETGTNNGSSTVVLAAMADKVWTVELNPIPLIEETNKFPNVVYDIGSSDERLACNLPRICAETFPKSVLCMLDAHWYSHWPIFGELDAINQIRKQGYKLTVVIDDFFIPNCPQFAGCFGGLRADDAKGRESQLMPCAYETFKDHLDVFPAVLEPCYESGGIGYGIFSDFALSLGPDFVRYR